MLAWTGISTGFVDGAVDAWEGLISLGDKETWLNMRDAIVNYRETIPLCMEHCIRYIYE